MKIPFLLSALAAAFLAASCDTFTLTDQFEKKVAAGEPEDPENELALELSSTELQRQGMADLNPSGGTPPYVNYQKFAVDLPYEDSDDPLGSIDVSGSQHTYTAGKSIGQVKIRVFDSVGKTAEAFVTIVPPAISSLTVATVGSNTLNLTWPAYADTALISEIRISILKAGVYVLITTVDKNNTAFTHNDASILKKNTTYTYRAEAVANGTNGTYASSPVYGSGTTGS